MGATGKSAGVIASLGVLLFASLAWHLRVLDSGITSSRHIVAVVVFVGGTGLSLFVLAFWHWRHDLADDRYPRLYGWIFVLTILLVLLGIMSVFVGSEEVLRRELLEVLHVSASLGVLLGTIIGTGEAVTIEQERQIARAKAETTALREREEELERQRDRFEALFEAIPEPVVIVEFEDRIPRIQDVNEAFESTFGYDTETAIGENINDLVVPDDEEIRHEAERIDERTRSGDAVTREVRRETPNGIREFLFRSAPVETDGDLSQQFGLYVDITDRKEYEAELERKNEQLEKFARVLSHDLRNPLEVAKGRLQLGRTTGDEEHLEEVTRSLDRMQTLIEELLTLAREGERVNRMQPVDLAAAVERFWENVPTEDATLVVESTATIRADESRLQRLIENLLRNAVQHGGEGVTITIGDLDSGFYVADDGVGIQPEMREEIFEFGYSGKSDGTGFGLAIVKEITEAHGWEVSVSEAVDEGARFDVTGVEKIE